MPDKKVYFSPLSNAEQFARAANRVMRELPNYHAAPEVKIEAPYLDRAMKLHVEPNMHYIEKYAAQAGINPKLLMAVIAVEQRGNDESDKYRQSSDGASGIAQLMPVVQKKYNVDTSSVEDSIRGAAEYLGDMQKKFGTDFPVLGAAYHTGETILRRFNQQQEDIGPKSRAYAAFMDIMDDKLRGGEKIEQFLADTNPTERLRQMTPATR